MVIVGTIANDCTDWQSVSERASRRRCLPLWHSSFSHFVASPCLLLLLLSVRPEERHSSAVLGTPVGRVHLHRRRWGRSNRPARRPRICACRRGRAVMGPSGLSSLQIGAPLASFPCPTATEDAEECPIALEIGTSQAA